MLQISCFFAPGQHHDFALSTEEMVIMMLPKKVGGMDLVQLLLKVLTLIYG